MAASQAAVFSISALPSSCKYSSSISASPTSLLFLSHSNRKPLRGKRLCRISECRAMVQEAVQGAPAAYAKEMERLSAKESLLLAFKDAGGFEALVTGKTSDMQRIDVTERITSLERLNPTPRPTTSPFLEGRWNCEWFGSGSPGLFAARFIFENFPSSLATLSKMDVYVKDGNANITASMRLLNSVLFFSFQGCQKILPLELFRMQNMNSELFLTCQAVILHSQIESKIILSTKLSVEGPLRLKEEFVEGILESPKVIEESVPEQLKGALGQAANAVQQLPVPIRDAVTSGLKVPLSGSFQRLFMISYLDDEILIIRDTAGMPEVLTRLDASPSSLAEASPDYES
ncbi:probable plastid-lipid-associated protein 13, chloroplastic isoform X2 [Prosopis cineraria]|uniref:probable plastid-lipid-associated protein 13, chloroplastic isoform X2 n=1 Tax=Prosopis cineraria TaxID=364024 RepID=UPI0024106303|nr:probable plastid-lipid-associated protein 13, chloroplastic isoform X2 [Prosopis cineraria]